MKKLIIKQHYLIAVLGLLSLNTIAQPRFVAVNGLQVSRITGSSSIASGETVKNIPVCFTMISVGSNKYVGGDFSMIPALFVAKGVDKNDDGYSGFDAGFLSMYFGKQYITKEKYTVGVGFDADLRGFGFSGTLSNGNKVGVENGMYTIGPSVCGQYRLNKILTLVSVFGVGIGTGWEMQWRNSISVGYGKIGLNIQPDLNYYSKEDFSKDKSKRWGLSSTSLRLGISFRLD